MRISTLIFDVDGTLLDTNRLHVDAWHEAFASHGHNVSPQELGKHIGKGGDSYVPSLLGEEIDKREGDTLRKVHTQLFLDKLKTGAPVNVFPGVVDTFVALRQRGIKLLIATSSKKKELVANQNVAGIDFESFVDAIVTGDDADASKPAPDIVAVAVKQAKVSPAECLMIGDTPYDGQAANGAGVGFIGVTCGGCFNEQELKDAGALHVYRDLAAMCKHLDELLR